MKDHSATKWYEESLKPKFDLDLKIKKSGFPEVRSRILQFSIFSPRIKVIVICPFTNNQIMKSTVHRH